MAKGEFKTQVASITESLPNIERNMETVQGFGESLAAVISSEQGMGFLSAKFIKEIDENGWFRFLEHERGSHIDINMKPENRGVVRFVHAHGTSNQEVKIYKLMSDAGITQGMTDGTRLNRLNSLSNDSNAGHEQVFVHVSERQFNNIAGIAGNNASNTLEEELLHNPYLLTDLNGNAVVEKYRQKVSQ